MVKTNRIFYLDAMRLMAIIGIIFCHASITYVVSDMGTPNFYVSAFYDCFRDFCVPIFVMLSGALLIGKKDSAMTFFKKRLTRILVPLLFWSLISIIYPLIHLKHAFDIETAIDVLLGHGGTLGVTFWFVWMIMVVYVGIFVINRIIEFANMKIEGFDGEKFIQILGLLSSVYIVMFQFHLLLPVFYDSILIYYMSFITYAVIGYCLVNTGFIEFKIETNKLAVMTSIISLILYLNYICNYVVPTSLLKGHFTYLGYFNIHILLISASIFLTVKFISNTAFFKKIEKNKIGDAIRLLSKYSYGIYLCHYLVLFDIKRNLILYFIDYTKQNSIIWIPLLAIVTMICSFVILWILNRIPILNKVTGAN